MLVLSRRVKEKIIFPNLGITVELLGLQKNAAKLGIQAPPEVAILREEIVDTPSAEQITNQRTLVHELSNHLNKINLYLELFNRQRQARNFEEAERTLSTVFEILQSLDNQWIRQHVQEPTPQVTTPIRCLVVEDDQNERELLAGLLNMQGCQCDTAEDGLAALTYLETHSKPDVLILDLWMPRYDGSQTLAKIRADHQYAGLKVYAVSGTSPEEAGVSTGPAGIDAWFPKPLNTRRLWEAIQTEFGSPMNN